MLVEDKLTLCCGIVRDYPDFIHGVTWGSLNDKGKRQNWNDNNCHKVVGGSNKMNCEITGI